MHSTTLTFVKKNGQLIPSSEREIGKLKQFNIALKEGSTVEVYMSLATENDKTLPQLARIHAMIRELSNFTGHTFDEVKDEVKRKAGLHVVTGTRSEDLELKSFTDCSKEELSKAIDTCVEIGHMLGYHIS